ncbi:hypothetical protein [Plastoroseomonas hellenica]|uniref:hypothetical protein n=1 Tax=Plastoroseomonas hellenica TaxID=2687306 RepID=UPI001BAD4B98|nr:hypothetical protein [Plastoroseomonas hellenica]
MIIRPASAADAGIVAGFVDALLVELSGAPSRPEARLRMAAELLAGDDRVFGFLAFAGEAPVGVIMLAESAAIYAGGAFGVITEFYVVRNSAPPASPSAWSRRRWISAAAGPGAASRSARHTSPPGSAASDSTCAKALPKWGRG